MRDIANAAGVSQSTVSRVLSGSPTPIPIAEETRRKILTTADKLRYQPNPLARALRGAKTMLIGAIVRDITDPFFSVAIEALSSQGMARGYNVVLGNAHSQADEAIALREILETRHCDALVVLGDMRDQPKLIDDLRRTDVPVVELWQGGRPEGVNSVNVDNRAGINAVLEHLADLGHSRIAFVGQLRQGDLQEREAAYVDYLRAKEWLVPDGFLKHAVNTFAGGQEAAQALLKLPEPPTAIVAATDVLAIGALHGAHLRGVTVPDDVSVTGFDDIPLSAFTVPSLTTIHMPTVEMVTEALDIVLGPNDIGDSTSGSDPQVVERVLPGALVIRNSTCPHPK
jgi:DNA-binding LacI/PurR family transcriptional regulator